MARSANRMLLNMLLSIDTSTSCTNWYNALHDAVISPNPCFVHVCRYDFPSELRLQCIRL